MQRMTNMHTQRWQRAKLRFGYGNAAWTEQAGEQLGLQSTLRGRGRPHNRNPY